jgi:D-3-phosphoglycerate dehydrogenase
MANKVFIATKTHPVLNSQLSSAGYICVSSNEASLLAIADELVGIITSNNLEITADLIDQLPQLQWVGRLGSGMEIIDVEYARAKGIACFSTPQGNANAVAEQALGMLLALNHNILKSHLEVKAGIWERERNRGIELEGKTAGIIGYGNNGMAFAEKLRCMGVSVLAYDKYKSGFDEPGIQSCQTLEPIWEQANILSFHVPLNAETYHYFNKSWLQKMQQPITLLNLSRGSVVETEVVLTGMLSGKIVGAALDVWEQEPLPMAPKEYKSTADALLKLPNFIGTPHIAGYTYEALYKMSYMLAEMILNGRG